MRRFSGFLHELPAKAASQSVLRILPGVLGRIALMMLGIGVVLLACFFPYDTDAPMAASEMAKEQAYYANAFALSDRQLTPVESPEEERYVKIGEKVAKVYHIEEDLQSFLAKYGLAGSKALDVGSGRGYLQDMVQNYTGLDISPTSKRFYHKEFRTRFCHCHAIPARTASM